MSEVAPNLTRYGDVEEANYFAQATALAEVSKFISTIFDSSFQCCFLSVLINLTCIDLVKNTKEYTGSSICTSDS